MTERIFTDAELKEMGVETVDLIRQAIDAGDLEKAKKLTRRMWSEAFNIHEGYRDIITHLLSFIGRRMGDEGLIEAMRYGFQEFIELARQYENVDLRRQVEMLAVGIRGHLCPLEIEEDDEKVTLKLPLCGSGGRAVLNGGYDPPKNFLKIKNPQLMTFGRSDFPVYCAHCYFQDILPIETTGMPIWITVPSDNIGVEPCKCIFYKDPAKIPEEYYKIRGMKKPPGGK